MNNEEKTKNAITEAVPTEVAEQNLNAMSAPATFIPPIRITYALSKHFKEGKAKLGEFFYGNDLALGNTIKVTFIAYRYQAMAINKNSRDVEESLVLGEHAIAFRKRQEYINFCLNNKRHDIIDGIDLLLFLPEHNLFGVLFAKKHIYDGGLQIIRKASKGKIAQIKTKHQEYRSKEWYTLEVQGLDEIIEIPDVEEKIEIYNNQIENAEEDTEGKTDGRER